MTTRRSPTWERRLGGATRYVCICVGDDRAARQAERGCGRDAIE
jgi:hypothetical protein